MQKPGGKGYVVLKQKKRGRMYEKERRTENNNRKRIKE
jgi:hypothetical protein